MKKDFPHQCISVGLSPTLSTQYVPKQSLLHQSLSQNQTTKTKITKQQISILTTSKKTQRDGGEKGHLQYSWTKRAHIPNIHSSKNNLQTKCNIRHTTKTLFVKMKKKSILKFIQNRNVIAIQSNPNPKGECWRHHYL